ncbi:MAG TPA: YkoF family thiamine/hydroxymethylpyrimidine-binding protein [Caldilineaceae bacterium]|nr:YkoF family thiamine/hydroxymethylpyrimidine-binding protein [Caldilineaceae bacterium]
MFAGCQFSLYPMTDRFVEVILEAVADLRDRQGLRVETDDLSTLVVGPPEQIFQAVEGCFCRAARGAGHVVLTATFSRGCPGEPDDPICEPAAPNPAAEAAVTPATVAPAGIPVAAQFALYPLGIPHYMNVIYDEIEATKQDGLFSRPKHFCTRLDGDARQVFAALQAAFDRAARHAGHVVITATISKGSPTPLGQ